MTLFNGFCIEYLDQIVFNDKDAVTGTYIGIQVTATGTNNSAPGVGKQGIVALRYKTV